MNFNSGEAKHIDPIQFITPSGLPQLEFFSILHSVLDAGVRWVQFRYKPERMLDDLELDVIKTICRETSKLCIDRGARFIINDFVNWADEIPCHGVHLGREDMPLLKAREILGGQKIIGATANNLQDIIEISRQGVADYIGLGPYRMTKTKKKLAPILGDIGMKHLILETEKLGISLRFIAVGGLNFSDGARLKKVGCQGMAACTAFINSSTLRSDYLYLKDVFG